jgi:hypothetical protein
LRGGSSYAADATTGQRWLEDVGSVCKKFRVCGLSPIPLRLSVVPLTNHIYEARG